MTVQAEAPNRPRRDARVTSALLDDLRESPVTIYPLIAVLLLVAWLPASAAYSPAVYCAGALGVLILIVASVAHGPSAPLGGSRARTTAIAAALAFVLWNYASLAWADDAGAAFDGANRTALFAALFVLFALTSWTPRLVYLAVGTYATGAVAISAVQFFLTVHSARPDQDFISGRLTLPAGYENASAALLITSVLAAIVVASRPGLPAPLRALMFGVAAAGAELAILAQSRGSVLGAAVALPVLLLVVPHRHRVAGVILVVGACVLFAAGPLVDVNTASDNGFRAFDDALHRSLRLGAVSVAAAVVAGLVWSFALRFVRLSPRVRVAADRAVAIVVVCALVAPLAFAALRPHSARHAVSSAWHSFANSGSPSGTSSRFTTLGSDRYDLYRVALKEISSHPLTGVGSDNFAIDYLRHRRTDAEPLYPHSDVLRVPAQTGIVGTLLALVFVGALLAAAARSWRSAPTAAVALLIPLLYWLVHGAFDWLWEVAGVTAPLAAWAGAAVSLRATPSPGRPLAVPMRAVVACAALLLAVPLAADWVSGRDVNNALDHWRTDPARSLGELDRASRLDPFSDRAALLAAAIAGRVGAPSTMGVELRRAARRNPDNWYTHLLLAVLASNRGSWATAARQVAIAGRLNPREPTIPEVRRDVSRRRAPRLQSLEEVFLDRAAKRVRSGVTR